MLGSGDNGGGFALRNNKRVDCLIQAGWISNACGGRRFRTLPNGLIEVEHSGIPIEPPNTLLFKQLEQTWKNWRLRIRWNAWRNNLLPSQLLAVATKETGKWSDDRKKQATIGSPAGAVGVMQIMPCRIFQKEPYKSLICTRDRSDPDDSFYIGAFLLGEKICRLGGLPAAASEYNAGSLRCQDGTHANNVFKWHHEHNYSMVVTKLNNAAIEHLGVNRPLWPWITGVTAVAALGLGYAAKQDTLRLPARQQ